MTTRTMSRPRSAHLGGHCCRRAFRGPTSALTSQRHDLVGCQTHVTAATQALHELSPTCQSVIDLTHDDRVIVPLELDFGAGTDPECVPQILGDCDLTFLCDS